MTDNDLARAAALIHDELLDIAQMFADAEHYKAAIQMQGFARLVVDEAAMICGAEPSKQQPETGLGS